MNTEIFRQCRTPVDLMRLARVEPPSPFIAAIHSCFYGSATAEDGAELEKGEHSGDWTGAHTLVACIGRRGLKTSGIDAWAAAFEMLCSGHEDHAQPGSRIHGLIIAPEMRQAREEVREIRAVFDRLKGLGVEYTSRESGDRFELQITEPACPVERVLLVLPASDVSVRGHAVAFACIAEAGFFTLTEGRSARDVVDAVRPGQAQFPRAKLMMTSSCGPPEGAFHDLVSNPPPRVAVVRAPTWVANPRISRERCLEMSHDQRHFQQEYESSRFGARGENFLESGDPAACVDEERCSASVTFQKGQACIGLDVGQIIDATGIVIVSCFDVQVSADTMPVRHVTVHYCEQLRRTGLQTHIPIERIIARVASLAKQAGGAPVLHDQYKASEVRDALTRQMVKTFQCSTGPKQQEPRWLLLAELIRSRRLHLPNNPELISQLRKLKATQLPSGALKVEGKRDDLCDALALAVEFAIHPERIDPTKTWKLTPTTGGTNLGFRILRNGDGRVSGWETYHRDANGDEVSPSMGSPEFERHALRLLATGASTPAIELWLKARAESQGTDVSSVLRDLGLPPLYCRPSLNKPVKND